ncbi:hypothetical protein UPYG_G00067620 [Umbra pygmaea]|uniref:Uncharacterized protein n=1 Tax=Umbra pygmaea TaxID=75934 RepID=A0ABD0XSK7_UMBPY
MARWTARFWTTYGRNGRFWGRQSKGPPQSPKTAEPGSKMRGCQSTTERATLMMSHTKESTEDLVWASVNRYCLGRVVKNPGNMTRGHLHQMKTRTLLCPNYGSHLESERHADVIFSVLHFYFGHLSLSRQSQVLPNSMSV